MLLHLKVTLCKLVTNALRSNVNFKISKNKRAVSLCETALLLSIGIRIHNSPQFQ